jgi:1-acyl-sn-glycerol-3-phosphate acyltransferase
MSSLPPAAPKSNARECVDTYADPLLIGFGLLLGLSIGAFILGASPSDPGRALLVFGPMLLGLILPRLKSHHYRALGILPHALIACLFITGIAAINGSWCDWTVGFYSFFLGLAIGGILRFRDSFRQKIGRFGLFTILGLAATVAVVAAFHVMDATEETRRRFEIALPIVTAIQLGLACWLVARPCVEFTVEVLLWPIYRVRVMGPGLKELPIDGPCVIISNHAAWFDPLFLSKVLRRPTAPIMTERFYNIWFLRPILKYVTKVIVVPEVPIRRETPEIRQAIEALDQGRCLVIFPEGYLRRKEEVPLRRFGQGIWQILSARPTIPVFACWIEGGWGSYVSYFNGPPTKNKRLDFWHRIDIASAAPFIMPKELLADHMETRIYLMNKVLEARELLGLPALPMVELPKRDDEKAE